ncbi:thiamine pyrophosphate-binding protein [Brevirhabdus pacifica]|uniref:Thiamine pyrophosphate-binding protein n=2 Tax=Brevirhabdus pacifica TaxID=1267768 RepID=A0A1U7DM31_9RHOB|nr:thiamine pyrophosphate-dependent enzyme [Brevirhabdus pacifica]APX90928.1 thiamine pyrophosphate-binding protein [Brevirhabdus pacifica]
MAADTAKSAGATHGGDVLVRSLVNLGATRAFGVPGESFLAVLDGLHDSRGTLDFTLCRNEGGAAFMAEAWGKLTGAPGICFVTRGPGATNASIGVHTAMQDSTPMILFVGQIGTRDRDREAFQEVDYRAMFGPLAKWVTEIDEPGRIPELVSRAWATALSGRPGPVVVALPEDMLSAPSDVAPCGPLRRPEAAPHASDLEELCQLLSRAQRPLVIAGGGGWTGQGRDDLARFLEVQGLPVLSAFRYHDLVDNRGDFYAGDAGVGMTPRVRALISGADLVLALNIRFGEMVMDDWTIHTPPRMAPVLIHAHGSDRELNKIYSADLPIHAGPNRMAEALARLDRATRPEVEDCRAEARAGYERAISAPAQPAPVDMSQVMAHLHETLPDDAILTNGAGNFAIWPNKHFMLSAGQRLLAPQSGAMGYGVPAAIAARIAYPGRTVLCFAGDGDFQMTCSELGTAMQADARPVILVLNNGTYGTIRMHQERHYPDRVSGTDLVNPDFPALARAYGFHAERVERTEDFAAAFDRALKSTTGAVLELMVGAEALTPGQTLTQIREAGRKATSG